MKHKSEAYQEKLVYSNRKLYIYAYCTVHFTTTLQLSIVSVMFLCFCQECLQQKSETPQYENSVKR